MPREPVHDYLGIVLKRVLEPEVMDTASDAHGYDAMDHVEVNATFCEDFIAEGPVPSRVLDVGTGTARIPMVLCSRIPHVTVVAVDLADEMLNVARTNLSEAGLTGRVVLERVDAKRLPFPDGAFEATISNSIIHHIPEPRTALSEMWRVTAKGGLLFVRDLFRPDSEAMLDALVARYAGTPPLDESRLPEFEHQRALFRASLAAALTVEEVSELASEWGIPNAAVSKTSDRHWTLAVRRPEGNE